ncbi:glycosyltransferase family 28 domain-containing protein [Xylariales sp. PMI_506]|nr:glycosyltransferase family 28 domain-containing protein [Xylariales sp. PMI_506]
MAPSLPDTTSPSIEDVARRRSSKKLQKKRREGHQPTMELPDRLKDISDEADEDLIPQHAGQQMFMNMNQSIFGLLAAAGSNVDFSDRFEGQSSDEDEGAGEEGVTSDPHKRSKHKDKEHEDISKSQILSRADSSEKKHRRRISGQILRSLPQLSRLSSKAKHKASKLKPLNTTASATPEDDEAMSPDFDSRGSRPAPVMSRMLEARAEMSSRPSFDLERLSSDMRRGTDSPHTADSALSRQLKEIFEFDHPEKVLEEYPCWLLQSVLLQGYMYITAKHICFYAYLPKKAHEVAKSGYLSKSGKRNPKYTRYWFRLKGDVLGYYRDSSNLYFPSGQIDLRYAISANITDKDKEGLHFSVVTDQRTYHFKADSAPSAKEWVKSLQRVIFRSHNDGDSVKISLPIDNVIELEETNILEFAETCKIKVIDNEETYAIDEYFFSFFSFGKEAINVLKILVEDAASRNDPEARAEAVKARHDPEESSKRSSISVSRTEGSSGGELKSAKVRDHVKATLSPITSPRESNIRASGDYSRSSFDAFRQFGRRSLDLDNLTRENIPRRSFSGSRSHSKVRERTVPAPADKQASSDSYVQSLEDPSLSNLVASSSEDPTASQILKGSEVFHNPTIQRRSASTSRSKLSEVTGQTHEHHHQSHGFLPRHAATTGHLADPAIGEKLGDGDQQAPTLQSLAKMGSYPLQRAGLFADYLNRTSRQMGNLLATESMGYVEKVSGMWKGGRKHYHDPVTGLKTEYELDDDEDDEDVDGKLATTMERFRNHFALPETEKLQATFFGFIVRVLPLYGKIYISDRSFCFRSLLPGTRTKLILPIKDIETVHKEKGFRFGYSGLVLVIRGHEELFFEFSQVDVRDDCAVTMLQLLETARYLRESEFVDKEEQEQAQDAIAERDALNEARLRENPEHELKLPRQTSALSDSSPTILFDDPKASFLNFKPSQPLKITCLTIGSRGDVQPYIALCKGLLAEGHQPRIATHAEFKGWIEGHGIEFAPVAGDPGELMRLCIENGTFTLAFLREANSTFRVWLEDLLGSAFDAVKGSDLLIESPSAMAGIHIAEALSIPYFRAFTMPWTRTRAYPHAFVTPEHKMGGAYNYVTYVMFDNVFWKATAGQINKWRKTTLGLPPTTLEKLQPNKVPFLYNFSPSVVAPPLDYSDWIRVTGYWFLDEGNDWTPPPDLRDFIEQARKDGKKLVYVGFGSIIVSDPAKMTQEVIDAVLKADVRCVLSKGWSDRMGGTSSAPEPTLPPEIFQIKSAPHDWLFAQMDAAAHHGGSGTTGASLRAGIPTIIRPFFGDQFFFGGRVEDLGVGICLKKWGAASFAKALWEACNSERMIVKARVLGESIRKDNGVDTAIQCIYRDLEYARSLIVAKAEKHPQSRSRKDADAAHLSDDEDEEESWTFVGSGEDVDPELVVKKSALAEAEQVRSFKGGKTSSLGSRVLSPPNRGIAQLGGS